MGKPRNRRPRKPSGISRRDFLKRAGAASAASVALAACGGSPGGDTAAPADDATQPVSPFQHGLASGDPLPDRVILWTRVTPQVERSVTVELLVATDVQMTQGVQRASFITDARRDYTVKLDLAGLQAGTTYYYRFSALGHDSATGRTRTAPAGVVSKLRFGVASCASYAHGYFNAYRRLAEREDIDAVLHLGDYIYEYGNGEYGSLRQYQPAHEIITLSDYRRRHAHYKGDADLQALHARHPMIAVWDDHETANNSWRDGAENHTEASEGAWSLRKAAGVQAYAEWMPIRLPDESRPEVIYRRFKFGDLVELVMLDTRLIGRELQASALDAGSVNDGARELLGAPQRSFLASTLASSASRWKLLGQQVMFGQLRLPGLPELSTLTGLSLEQLQALLSALPLVSTGGFILNTDQWDGYRAERSRVFDLIDALKLDNLIVLTGDIHTSWAMDLTRDPNNPLAYNALTGSGSRGVELVASSITSPGMAELQPLSPVIGLLNPHIRYTELSRNGYLLLDIDHTQVQAQWWYVDTVTAASSVEALGVTHKIINGGNRLSR